MDRLTRFLSEHRRELLTAAICIGVLAVFIHLGNAHVPSARPLNILVALGFVGVVSGIVSGIARRFIPTATMQQEDSEERRYG